MDISLNHGKNDVHKNRTEINFFFFKPTKLAKTHEFDSLLCW